MPAINENTVDFWKDMAKEASKVRPNPGRRVQIVKGRKHKGKEGVVLKNIQDRYYDAFRYGGEASHHMTAMYRREGFVVLVEQDSGKTFWVRADYTEILG